MVWAGGSLRMSVVGSERRSGTEYFWLEFVMRGFFRERGEGAAGPERMISKMLVPGLGPGMGRPMQTVVKVGDAPAMEMPAGRPSPAGQGPTPLKDCRDAKVIGWESVTVPAGTFRALHVQGASGHGDTWVDPDLPFAMVKEAANDQGERSETVLTGHGMGARSQITERPRPWDARAFMEMVTGRTPPQR